MKRQIRSWAISSKLEETGWMPVANVFETSRHNEGNNLHLVSTCWLMHSTRDVCLMLKGLPRWTSTWPNHENHWVNDRDTFNSINKFPVAEQRERGSAVTLNGPKQMLTLKTRQVLRLCYKACPLVFPTPKHISKGFQPHTEINSLVVQQGKCQQWSNGIILYTPQS